MAFRHASDTKYPCPMCGKENTAHETFRCRRCGRQYLCVDHLNPTERVCEECVTIKKKKTVGEPGMVVIHEGEFFIGQDDDEECADAAPQHPLRLEQYLIDRDLVTNKEFKEFKPSFTYPDGMEDEPAVNVSWNEARDYAASKGKRLPSEPEWEKAARSRDKRPYPWGKDLPEDLIKAAGDVREGLKKFRLSPYQVRDMCCGIWEWTSSEYEPYPNGNSAIPGYFEGNKAIRGGLIGLETPSKTYQRSFAHPTDARPDIAFRCCKGAPQEYERKYAGAEIKRPKKADTSDQPPPEFKPLKTSKTKRDVTAHLDYAGLTVKDAIRKATAEFEGEKPAGDIPKQKEYVDDWPPVDEKPKTPWAIIIGVVVVIIIIIAAFAFMNRSSSSGQPAPKQMYEQIANRSVQLSQGNIVGSSGIFVEIGDRVTITVRGWNSSDPDPPLMGMIENGPETPIGAHKTFIADAAGEIKLVYRGDTIQVPSGSNSFLVQIKVEHPK